MLLSTLVLCLPVPALAPQDPEKVAEFSKQMLEAAEVGDTKALSMALQKYKEDAILAFLQRADARSMSDEAAVHDWVDTFIEAWDKTYRSEFARNYDRYMQRLADDVRSLRYELLTVNYPERNALRVSAMNGEAVAWNILRENAVNLAKAMDGTRDLYYAARVWNIVGNVYNPDFHGDGANAQFASEAYANCLKARDSLGLTNDRFYSDVKKTLDGLRVTHGLADPDNPDAVVEKKEPKEKMKPIEGAEAAEGLFEHSFEKKAGAIAHASDLSDSDHFNWRRGNLPKIGEQVNIGEFTPPIVLLRVADSKYRLDGGLGEGKDFRLSEKPALFTFDRQYPDGSVRSFSLELCTGTSSDVYQGVTMNLAPHENGGSLFFRSRATVTAKTAFGPFTIYDTSCDGNFGVEKLSLIGAEGLPTETFLYRPDAMTLGKMKHSLPFSRFFPDAKGNWYELEMSRYETPGEFTLTPVEAKLGMVSVDYPGIKKLKLNSLLVASRSSATEGMVLDLATFKGKEFGLPVGRYEFLQARFTGKGGHEMMVLPNATLPYQFDVVEGGSVTVELGAPFKLQASTQQDGKQLTVLGKTLVVIGRGGERYLRCIGEPMFGISVDVKGAKEATLAMPTADEAAKEWDRLFYPMDAVVELRRADAAPEVTLSIKKHPWFGKLSTVLGG